MGFPVACSSTESRKSGCAESKPRRQVKGGYISSVIYQEYVIRLIIVSGFLSNYMPMNHDISACQDVVHYLPGLVDGNIIEDNNCGELRL